jgi:acyl dehydratase
MPGLYYEELEIGRHFVHDVTRTVTETDNLLFTTLTHNTQPLHLDIEFCKQHSEFGGILVNSVFTFGLMLGVSVSDTTLGTTVANLGMDDVKFPAPVHIGDTLRSETTVIERRDSKSRPDAGIVVFEHKSFNQKNILVAHCKRSALMKRKPK